MNGANYDRKTHYELVNKYFRDDATGKKGYYKSKDTRKLKQDLKKRGEWKTYTSTLDKVLKADKQVSSAVDVGCGIGNFTLELIQRKKFKKIVGIDLLKETFDIARENKELFDAVNFVQGNLLELPFKDKSFDLTVCLNVIHHIHKDDFAKVIDELSRITKKYLMLEIRNEKYLFEFWYYKVLIQNKYKNLPQHSSSIPGVNDMMKKNGFEVKMVRGRMPFTFLCRRITIVYKRL